MVREEVVNAVDKEEKDVDIGILMLIIMLNGKLQASMDMLIKLIHRIVLNHTSGSIYLRMYEIN